MSLFGKKPGNGDHKGSSGSVRLAGTEYADISKLITDRLSSEHDEKVLMGIGDVMRGEQMGRKYRPSEVVDKLAEVLQFPHGDEVMGKAGDALIEKLKNGVHEEDAELIITNRLGRKTEANAKFFLKMLERLEYKPRLRKLAVEMLAGFRGAELSTDTIDNIEMTLFERLSHAGEHEEVKKAIKERFGKEGKGRPQLKVEESRTDETVALEAEPDVGRASFEALKADEIPTSAMDITSGFISQLKSTEPKDREAAAKALVSVAESSKSRSQIERIRDALHKGGAEFFPHYRQVLGIMQRTIPERDSRKPVPIALGPGNGKRPLRDDEKTPVKPATLKSKDPTPVAPIKTR